jgi:hypothetical protein
VGYSNEREEKVEAIEAKKAELGSAKEKKQ